MEKLFNKIFKTVYYPNSWNEGLIFSIHKSGEKENPNIFRDIRGDRHMTPTLSEGGRGGSGGKNERLLDVGGGGGQGGVSKCSGHPIFIFFY